MNPCASAVQLLRGLLAAALLAALPWQASASVTPVDDLTAVEALPSNLSRNLRQLVVWHRSEPRILSKPERRARLKKSLPAVVDRLQVNADATDAVVDVTLDGSAPLVTVRERLTQLGAEVFAQNDTGHEGGVLSTRMPLDLAEAAARLPGVYSLSLVHRAWRHVGLTTSQGAEILKTLQVNTSGFDGSGITVGVLSDSFNVTKDGAGYPFRTRANDDVLNGDLPGTGNPLGHTQPVQVIYEGSVTDDYHNNEGRAMCQIIHDLAPGAKLVFQQAGVTPEQMAERINALRFQDGDINGGYVACDVIVDDFGFPDEPMFSDGVLALAARNAATSVVKAGHPAVYVSAAGNRGDAAYSTDFTPVGDAVARSGIGVGNLQLKQVPVNLTAGGFHNFNPKPGGKPVLGQKVKLRTDAEVSFQWDDPFLPRAITADYNLLVFDAQGNYLPDLSGTDDNVSLGKALEVVDLPIGDGDSATYQFAIALKSGGSGQARHLCYVLNGGDATIKYGGYNQGTTFGHNAGPNVIGVAAYAYDKLSNPEPYSSLGPVTIYFDAAGKRLAAPEIRQQPALAAVDGVNTSFFPPGPLKLEDGSPATDSDGDGFPNFFGTSAAAPHVAAVAALLLQAAGGPGSLTPAQVLTLLQSTAVSHDLDPNFSSSTLSLSDGSTVTLTATSDESTAASEDKNSFHLAYNGPPGQYLRKLAVDLAASGLKFDPSDKGLPLTLGTKVGLAAADVSGTLNATDSVLTLNFTPGTFVSGRSLNFGIDRDVVATNDEGNSADLLVGAIVKVRAKGLAGVSKGQGTLENKVGAGYSAAAGFGLVNAAAALRSLQSDPPPKPSLGLTSGNLLLTSGYNQVVEVRPDGTQVQLLPALPDPTNGARDAAYRHYSESVVDGNGNLAVLYDAFTLYLITLDLATGSTSAVTAPGWASGSTSANGGGGDEIVATNGCVYSTYHDRGYPSPNGSLLRFDPVGAAQLFGKAGGNNSYVAYSSLAAGFDGLLYALVGNNYSAPSSPVDVYDPKTLMYLRTITLNFQPSRGGYAVINKLAVGPTGEFYGLPSNSFEDATIYKFDATGQQVATLALPASTPGQNFWNLRANAQGSVVVGALDPILINPTFTAATVLKVFGGIDYTYQPSVTAAFVP